MAAKIGGCDGFGEFSATLPRVMHLSVPRAGDVLNIRGDVLFYPPTEYPLPGYEQGLLAYLLGMNPSATARAPEAPYWDRPCAIACLTSYRYRRPHGFVMIGARDHEEALREAQRSISEPVTRDNLEVWDGARYAPVADSKAGA